MKLYRIRFLSLSLGFLLLFSNSNAQDLKIILLAIGQNDAQLIIGPEKSLLIDVGGGKSNAEKVAWTIFKETGKKSVDYFLVSHYHSDHIGRKSGYGIWYLLEDLQYKVVTVIDRGDNTEYGKKTSPHKNYIASIEKWKADKRIKKRITAKLGDSQIDLGAGVKVEIVAVNGNDELRKKRIQDPDFFKTYPASENDYSIALKISVGDFEYFTGGDLSGKSKTNQYQGGNKSSYNDIETSIAEVVGDIEVLRLNHHGSAHSSNPIFVTKLDPEISLSSTGQGNRYSHPTEEVYDRMKSTSQVFVTSGVSTREWDNDDEIYDDIVGDIVIEVNSEGQNYTVNGMKMKSYSEAEELSNIDAQETFPMSKSTQSSIHWSKAKNHIGETVNVIGKIASVKILVDGRPAFLNFSHDIKELSGVILADDLNKFGDLTAKYGGKKVILKGKITSYKGNPQILISDPSQILILDQTN